MAVTPTRLLNKQTPLSDMTIDQLLLIHGQEPVIKPIPERPYGAPRSQDYLSKTRDRVAYENPDNVAYIPPLDPRSANPHHRELLAIAHRTATEIEMKKRKKGAAPSQRNTFTTPVQEVQTQVPFPNPNKVLPPKPTPEAAKAYVLVEPAVETTVTFQDPCPETIELLFQVTGVGTIAYPLQCTVLGEHPNQPHMAPTPGRLAPSQNDPTDQEVFVCWDDALPTTTPAS